MHVKLIVNASPAAFRAVPADWAAITASAVSPSVPTATPAAVSPIMRVLCSGRAELRASLLGMAHPGVGFWQAWDYAVLQLAVEPPGKRPQTPCQLLPAVEECEVQDLMEQTVPLSVETA